jgi:hypothetical protein
MTSDMATLVGVIINALSGLALLVTVIIMTRQTGEMRRSTHATAFQVTFDMLQAEDVRTARGVVLSTLKDKPLKSWTEEEIREAEKVCYTYDSVAIMIRNGVVPVKAVADNWGDSLRRTWRILEPMVKSYRSERNAGEFWDDYEWLAKEAEKYQKPAAKVSVSPG